MESFLLFGMLVVLIIRWAILSRRYSGDIAAPERRNARRPSRIAP